MTMHLVLAVPWNREQLRLGGPALLVVCGCTAPLEQVSWFARRTTCFRCMEWAAWRDLWLSELATALKLERLKAP